MKNFYMIMRDGGKLKALPYEEGNALPCVYAENEEEAMEAVLNLYRMQQKAFVYGDVELYIENLIEDGFYNTEALKGLSAKDKEDICESVIDSSDYWDDVGYEIRNLIE